TDMCLPSCELRELVVGCPVAPRAEALAVGAPLDPAGDEPDHGVVELLRRHAPEDWTRDRRGAVEAAAQVHVVRLPAPPLLVADGRPLEADVADPVVRACVRAAVEVQAEAVELTRREPLLE